jgi:hypothetical protein
MLHRRGPGELFGFSFEGVGKRSKDSSNVGKEMSVEIEESQKTLELFNRSGCRESLDGMNVGVQGEYTSRGYFVAKIVNCRLCKNRFFGIDEKIIVLKNCENLLENLQVGVHVRCGYNEVI